MKRLKIILSLALAVLMLLLVLTACTPAEDTSDTTSSEQSSEPSTTMAIDETGTAQSSDPVTEPPTEEQTEAPTEVPAETSAETPTETSTETPTEPDTAPPADTLSATEEDTAPEAPPVDATVRPAQEVKVISMNLDANETTAGSRVRRMAPLLLSFDPDSIGVQECRGSWGGLLKKHFISEGYARVGVDAGGNVEPTGGYFATYILYKEDKFNLIDSGTFWLSTTPEVPSIYGPTVDCNRTCTWALLEDKVTGFRYVHMNCHLDWMDMSVNKIQVEMIREQIERFEAMGYPVFAGGDYNCDEGTDSYYTMLDSEIVADSKKVAEKANDIATYPSYGEYDVYDPSERPIDYFFVTKDHMTVKEYRVVDEKPDGEYISDHFPVFVHALVHEMPILPAEENTPAFSEGTTVTAETVNNTTVALSFPQAFSPKGVMAYEYALELYRGNELVKKATIPSGVLRLTPAETCVYELVGMNKTGDYTAKITAHGILGEVGQTLSTEFRFEYQATPVEMSAADILDIRVTADGPVDQSPNGYNIEKKGNPAIVETNQGFGMDFNQNGNYKISSIQNHYTALERGFTMEIWFTTGDDLGIFQSLVSNMHAGGFGVDWEYGKITFSVRIGDSYIGPSASIEENTTYHLVGVFTGSEVKLYLNGILMGETPVNGSLVHPTDNGAKYLCIGADSDATGAGEYPIDATVYLVRMYTAVATDENAAYLYEQITK